MARHMLASKPLAAPLCPLTWWLPERKPVTLIAGLKCTDGIVLAADTEESTYLTRGRARKLLARTFERADKKPTKAKKGKGDYQTPKPYVVVAIAGAGTAALIDAAVEQVFDAVSQSNTSTIAQLKTTISDALLNFYRHNVSAYPTRDPLDNLIDLICAVRAVDGDLALYRASGPLISTVSGFAICGSGEIIRHVLEELYQPTVSVPRAVALVLHLLNLGKRYVTGVGGDSEILTLTADGIPIRESIHGIKIREQHLDQFNRVIGELLLKFPDGTISHEIFAESVTQLTVEVQDLRIKQITELEAEQSRELPAQASVPGGATAPTVDPHAKPLTSRHARRKKATRQVHRGSKRGR
jgi:20S proteasome alpha/beta subunit